MKREYALIAALVGVPLLSGCTKRAEARPILTRDAFFKAAGKCRAADPVFTARFGTQLPSFSFEEGKAPNGARTSQCLADALRDYRFGSMEIRGPGQEAG